MNSSATDWNQILTTFKQIWGYEDFRPPQGEIVRSLLASKDTLIVMPTGSGKSICFQLPALLQTGLTLVISPLVALMENQVEELRQHNLPAALLHHELPTTQRKQTLQALEKQRLRLLYLSPETLLSPPVWERLAAPQLKINGLILDEAHCLVQWGDVFRPAYRRLGAVRPALLKSKPSGSKIAIAAFTATADSFAQQTIQQVMQLQQPKRFCINPYRANLNLSVQMVWTPKCRRHQMLKFIQAKGQQPGLVYVRSRKESEALAQWLRSLDYSTVAYHAGLSAQARREIETHWLEGKTQFVVSTSAFGMGINKRNCHWIVHFHAPQLLSEYLQEVGRGGRDGQPTDALTLISEPTGWLDSEDKRRQQYFIHQLHKQYQQAQQIAKKIPSQGESRTIAQQFRHGEMTLSLLHSAHYLEWLDPFHYQLQLNQKTASLTRIQATQQQWHLQMTHYLTTRKCRWQFLLDAFGFKQEAVGFRCGHCDNCRRV